MSTIPVSSVEQITAPVELTDDILRSEVADILPLNQLQTLEAETLSSTVNSWLTQLKIEYTTENNQTKDMAIVIDNTRYTIVSPEDFESRVEATVHDYIRTLEGLAEEKQEALLSYITAIEVDVVLPTVAAVEEQEISTTQEIFDEALTSPANHPRLFDLLPGTQLYDVMQDYAEQHNISVEALAEKIAGTQQEIIQRFFVGIPLTEQNKQVISTATSLYLFQLYSSDSQMREEMFAGEEALQIKGDNIFGELFAWTKEIGTKNLFQMSGIMQFFMIFKDEEIQVALTEARQYKTSGGAQIDGMRNPYLENPHKFYQLMQGYLTQPAAERTDRVKQQLLAVNNKVNGETLPEYIVDDTEKKQMQAIVTNYGGNVKEFEQFMGYVDQGDTFLEHADEIKTSLIESDTLGGLAYMLTQAREVFGSLGNAFGTNWEESSLFKWIDGVLGWLGFDGLDGYVDERAIHHTIGPLVEEYIPEDTTRTRTTPAFWGTLETVTEDLENQETILSAAGSIDIHAVYGLLSGDNTQKKDFLGDKGKNLNKLLPTSLHNASVEDRFMYASAFVIERMANSRLAKHLSSRDEFIKHFMLILAAPNKAKKYFSIAESHSKYLGEDTEQDEALSDENTPASIDGFSIEATYLDVASTVSVDENPRVYDDCSLNTRRNLEELTRRDINSPIQQGHAIDLIKAGESQGWLDKVGGPDWYKNPSVLQSYCLDRTKRDGGTIFDCYVKKDATGSISSGHRFLIFLDSNQVPYVLDASRARDGVPVKIKPQPLSTYLQGAGYEPDKDMAFYIHETSYYPNLQ